MMKTFSMMVCVIAMVTTAFAAETPPDGKSPAPANQETIVVSKAIALRNAIAVVTGFHDEIVGQGASAKAIQMPYDLSADTRWALNDDANALDVLIKNAQSIQKTLTDEAETKNGGPLKMKKEPTFNSNGDITSQGELSDMQVSLNKKIQDLLDSDKPVAKLFRIKRGDLKLGVNAIPGSALSGLSPIIDP
jgi:hypothetical protein